MSPEEEKERSRNKQVLEATESLKSNKWFNDYFLARLSQKIAEKERSILDNEKLTPEEMHDERVRRKQIEEIAQMVDRDEASARKGLGLGQLTTDH